MNPTASVYNDFSGLAELRARAGRDSPEAARETARQFEALFVQMMLKSMREANAAFRAGSTDTTYQEMFDQQIALELTRRQGIGLADVLMRQFSFDAGSPAAVPTPSSGLPAMTPARLMQFPAPAAATPSPAATGHDAVTDWRPQTPEQFLQDIWPHAERAASRLGVDARAIAAQAALETGWGQKMVRDGNGVSGNNLFNIKADSRWSGARLTVNTLEFEDGLPQLRQAQFRAYPSLADSFDDYVRFLSDNPRYADALRRGPSPHGFVQSLQEAGYATDPRYAEKLRAILDSPRFNQTLAALKNPVSLPITS
jgi:flagellar protein FlgJ